MTFKIQLSHDRTSQRIKKEAVMFIPLQILLLNNAVLNAELLDNELLEAHLNLITNNEKNKDDFNKKINHFSPNLIISEHNILKFNRIENLKKIKKFHMTYNFSLSRICRMKKLPKCKRPGW